MKTRMMLMLCLFCVTLLLFTACGAALSVPNVEGRPQTDNASGLGYEPPPLQTPVTAQTESEEKEPPPYWRGQSHTLPGTDTEAQSSASVSSGDATAGEPQYSSSSVSNTQTPAQSSQSTTEPPHTTAKNPNPNGEGRGDAFEIIEKSGNGTKEIQCTPFY